MKRGKKIFLGLLTIIAIIIILIISKDRYQDYQQQKLMVPVVNPKPTKWLTVYGHVDPRLQVKLTASYYTNNPACQVTINYLEGVMSPRIKSVMVRATPNGKGNYKLELPLDKYLPGFCKWEVAGIGYWVAFKGAELIPSQDSIIGLSEKGHYISKDGYTNYKCVNAFNQNVACVVSASNMYSDMSSKLKFMKVNFSVINTIKEYGNAP